MKIKTADRLNQVQEYYFSKKLEQIAKMRERGLQVINLGIGSPDLVPPIQALETASRALLQNSNHGYASYRSTPELRQAMAAWYQRTYEVSLNPETEILPLLGSKEGVLYLSMALLNAGDAVLVPNPGYPAYASVAELLGAKVITYDLTEENAWLPDLDALSKLDLSRVKLMWVNYPHMPSGQKAELSFFKKLVQFTTENQIVICNDNPYGLVLNETSPLSILKTGLMQEGVSELNSLSKSFNMAGWRVGMFLGQKELVDVVLRVKSNVDSGMFLPIQKGAAEALKVEATWHQNRNQIYQRRRKCVHAIFDLLKFSYRPGQVGLFVWAKAPDSVEDVVLFLDQVLEEAKVFLTPGIIFGSNGNRYARASLCATEETLELALSKIKEWLA